MKRIRLAAIPLCIVAAIIAGCTVIVSEDPLTIEEHKRLASIYYAKGDLALAEREYRVILKETPDDVDSLFMLGNIQLDRKRYGEAEGLYRKAIMNSPAEAPLYNNLSWAQIGAGNLDEAENMARKALLLDPARDYIYLDTLGVVYTKSGNFGLAETMLKEALEKMPHGKTEGTIKIYRHLLDLYRKIGDMAKVDHIAGKLRRLEEGVKR